MILCLWSLGHGNGDAARSIALLFLLGVLYELFCVVCTSHMAGKMMNKMTRNK